MPLLGDVVVKGEDGAGEVKGRVQGVGEVVAEGVVGGFGGDGDAVALGEVGRVELFLLWLVSNLLAVQLVQETIYLDRAAATMVQTPIVV